MPPQSSDGDFHRVANLSDLADGTMLEVALDGVPVLLTRRGDTVAAVGGVCPHAGGKLAEGIFDGERVICPWHKAAFSVWSGWCIQPPSVDDLRRFIVELRGGEIWLAPGRAPAALTRPSDGDPRCFVVIGAGAAGSAAVQTLCTQGYTGRIVLVDREGELPYDRTILSKYVLSETECGEKTPLQDDAFYRRNLVERRTAAVTALDPADRRISFADGSSLHYDAALIATGAYPKALSVPGGKLGGVFLLRSRADAMRILNASRSARHVVVAGAGFIGMEVAASLRERGLDVTVVAPEAMPFQPQLGKRVGGVMQQLHRSKGVCFRMENSIASLEGDDAVRVVVLKDGTRLPADMVVVGLGVSPETAFLDAMPRRKDGGLDVDPGLKLADGLYAAGDVAAFALRGDGEKIRVEHWRVAEQHGKIAALGMLGLSARYDAVPYFWTIHYKKRLDYVGHAKGDDELVVRGDPDATEPSFIAYYVRAGKVAAAAGLNADRDMAAVLALMTRRRDWTVDELHPREGSPADRV